MKIRFHYKIILLICRTFLDTFYALEYNCLFNQTMIFFLSDDFLPSSPVTMFSRVDFFRKKFSVGNSPIILGLKISIWFHRRFPCSFSEHTQWNEVEGVQCKLLAWVRGWTTGRTAMRQREIQKPIGLMSKRTILHVHHTFFFLELE